ncbi:DUF4301 family protein [bacterium]|nr:DUF4301 family protein [bacterium]
MITFTPEDITQLEQQNITPDEVARQLALFRRGNPKLKLTRPCTLNDGILQIPADQIARYTELATSARLQGSLIKFIPASGAASRMFRFLLNTLNSINPLSRQKLIIESKKGDSDATNCLKFIDNISNFAFYPTLREKLRQQGLSIDSLLDSGNYTEIVDVLLNPNGLDYSALPKGMIPFHTYEGSQRTPFQEHIIQANHLTKDDNKTTHIHFTVALNHRDNIRESIEQFFTEQFLDEKLDITYTIQRPSTDTIAVDVDLNLFRDDERKLLFRPGGHGALLDNLNEINSDIILIQNIDNIVPDAKRAIVLTWKRVLTGYLIELQNQINAFLHDLDNNNLDESQLQTILNFARDNLSCPEPSGWDQKTKKERHDYLHNLLNRPLRVCGMVENTGQPGGGPYWVVDENGRESIQIVEKSQMDLSDPNQQNILETSTHFNPVDIVAGVKNYKGEKFNLLEFRDRSLVFIAEKSHQGRKLKALERPGLWNGAMAGWNSVFVEVPAETFNPVKTVNDLLTPAHQ